jgi:predicted phosphoribosyltransferase
MGRIIADGLDGDLDVILVHKLRAPFQPELALGSIDEEGHVYALPHMELLGLGPKDLDAEKQHQLEALQERRRRYTEVRPPLDPAGRVVILVDDGIATGASMLAAIASVRRKRPAKIVVAAGVAPLETVDVLRAEADDVVCVDTPSPFFAIGEFFEDFSQVSDEAVVRCLRQPASSRATNPAAHLS